MVIARIESFILGKGIEDALTRAKAYVNAGANGIMIHSKEKLQNRFLILVINLENLILKSLWYVFLQHITV